jgi:hypothetical protein
VTWAAAFTACGAVLIVAAVLAFFGIAHVRLSGADAIQRDGLAPGRRAPRWSLTDAGGTVHTSPPAAPLQLVLFADHSLRSFPSVADGIRDLLVSGAQLEIVLLLRQASPMAVPALAELGLDGVAVLTGTPALYGAYNVRVGPFAMFVDSAGLIRASSLVNYAWQIAKLHQLAQLPVAASS